MLLCIIWHSATADLQSSSLAIAEVREAHSAQPAARDLRVTKPYADLGDAKSGFVRFAHLTTRDGLSQGTITDILQDRRGFMWFATRDGLDRYDGNSLVTFKHEPKDPWSLSANDVRDLVEDDQGHLWIATVGGGVCKFDPETERFTSYRHDPGNPNSISGDAVLSIVRDSGGDLWFGTLNKGLDKFDPSSGTFTHYLNDNEGNFVGRITKIIEDKHREIWFVGDRGLFHLNANTGQILRSSGAIESLSADFLTEDSNGHLWMLAFLPIVGLVEYDREAKRITEYSLGPGASGVADSKLLDDGADGFWVASSLGVFHFERRTKRLNSVFHHDETDPESLSDNRVVSIYKDRGGVLWVGTENGGINFLNSREGQFGLHKHRPGDPNSLSSGKVTALYEDPDGIVWAGFSPRALDRFDRKTGQITHYIPRPEDKDALSAGSIVNSIYRYGGDLWIGGCCSGLDRLNEVSGKFKHYRASSSNVNSPISDIIRKICVDRSGHLWLGQAGGITRFDLATGQFTRYRSDPSDTGLFGNTSRAIYQDHSGTVWFGVEGTLSHFDNTKKIIVIDAPDSRDPHRLQGGVIIAIHEDQTGTLWVGAWDGLYRYNRPNGTFTRYTESQGLPSSVIQGILEDKEGKLWLSTKRGLSRFDPKTETFRNYDVSDGLQGDEFSEGAYAQGPDGEMLFGGNDGFNAFFPEDIRDNRYVPPVVITSLKIFNKPVSIGPTSVLTKAIAYADFLTLSYRDNVVSFEFAALSYANSQKNRYRYKLENFDSGWNEVGSNQRSATYTNLDPGRYVFHVQGSNSDGVWNEQGASLTIVITPPWWKTAWFRILCALFVLISALAGYQLHLRQLRREFEITLDARVRERTSIARELHDTLLQSFHGLMLRFQLAAQLLPARPEDAKEQLDITIDRAGKAITECRDAVQGLRESTLQTNDLAHDINTLGQELAADPANDGSPRFGVTVEGHSRDLIPIVRDEVIRIAGEALRNAFRHAQARHVEVEIRYDEDHFQLHVRDDGKGMDPAPLSTRGAAGHYGLPGMRERAHLIGGDLTIWSELGSGTEVELRVPANAIYTSSRKGSWFSQKLAGKA